MGLLTDFTVKDMKTKRRINMLKTVIIMACLIGSLFIPQVMDLAYQQGRQFGKDICLVTEDQFKNLSKENISEFLYGLEKTP
jgi:hypothetical protein